MSPPVPTSWEAITASWLGAALGVSIDALNVTPFDEDRAFLGRLARLEAATADGPLSAVAKLPTTSPGGRAVGEMLDVWNREARFYDELAHRVDVSVPARLYAASDGDDHILVLQDLAPAASGSELEGATDSQAALTVEALGALHGPWWGKVTTEAPDWLPRLSSDGVSVLPDIWAHNLPAFLRRYEHVTTQRSRSTVQAFVPQGAAWIAETARGAMTLAHADPRLANLMFDDDRVWLIDWQTAMATHGCTDLAFFMATNIGIEDRRANEADLLDRYAAALAASGAPVGPAEVRHEYRRAILWWMGMLGSNLATIEPDAPGQEMFDAMIERLFTAADDLDVDQLLS